MARRPAGLHLCEAGQTFQPRFKMQGRARLARIVWAKCRPNLNGSDQPVLPPLSTTHNHNSYTKIPKKIYHHKTKIIVVMRDIFSNYKPLIDDPTGQTKE